MLGIMRRIAGSYGKVRPEMAEGCPERIDVEFFRYVWNYRRQQRPKLLDYFRGCAPTSHWSVSPTGRRQNDYLKPSR